jgi:hypothetical protein
MRAGPDQFDHLVDGPDRTLDLQAVDAAIGIVCIGTDRGNLIVPQDAGPPWRKTGWSINYLFAPKFTLGKATIKQVALGSMLLVVQDSYSRAHAARSYGASTK